MVDQRLIEEEPAVNKEDILKVAQIALLYTQGAPHMRPLMSKVVSVLTSNAEILIQPTQPAFIDNNSRANRFVAVNIEEMEAPLVASSQAPVSISLEIS
ncbi:hypothetical protein SUGI_0678520 [Cryptomeria japonica]|nr:hypothetical protein SUGI_0678520 [Cryptomeria japonica]